ncbi:thymidylate synthase [Spiroplasma sabaudiense Ar-1343]|uniref:Thymidylate synthase n=1 Tax=Spiroplasma sabaudiense Ar-1343 TaxID=1276257 RepID=W6AAF5_9MOLU|nr:thymidylate synthase [Spiroplasma sabaudiense]AHI53991.1 thymidylate synthase [Spiroplasma sabaudiense Ar-1343]
MKQYFSLVKTVLEQGQEKNDRTNTGTISYFGTQHRFDLSDGFPILTTKKVYFKAIVVELLWFISGDTNIKYLVDRKVNIWNEWPYENYKKTEDFQGETLEQFIEKIRFDSDFAQKHGDLGPVYGKQWRNFNGVDQLKELICNLKNNPDSRRHLISSWNPAEINHMALPPCHSLFQFYVTPDGRLNLQLYQRSGDVFLGIPFNISSYALLLILIAREVELTPGEFIHTIGDAHIYKNHLEQIEMQLLRKPKKLPQLVILDQSKSIFDLDPNDISLENYNPDPAIKGKVAV